MSIHSGTITIDEIIKIYNVGYSYAENILNKLNEIGYIKKRTDFEYSMIQTERTIDAYIKEHFEEFRPYHYNTLELKNNGKLTLKARTKKAWKAAPMFMCRVFISPFSIVLFIMFPGFASIIWGAICNIIYGISIAPNRDVKFIEFMLRPWFNVRFRTINEIRGIMRKSNIKFKTADYYETLKRLKIHLGAKKKLAEHYADMANNAENENEFYQSINSCLEILEWMSQFEKYGVYDILSKPSDDIKNIKDGMPISIQRFNNRMKSSGKITSDFDMMDGHQFEHFCAGLLKQNGFADVEVTQGSGDHGIDVLAEKDGITYAIQCKCYSDNIGNAAVQQAHTGKSLYHKDIAVVMTNRYFTAQAKEEAKALGVKLWDRDKLNEMIGSQSSPPST